MAVFKCKMCGGQLEVQENQTVIECEYCGTQQTLPTLDNEKKLNLFNRANRLRMSNEFDKAAGVFESIVAEFPEEAEAYWGLVLCKYGIEYVDDPATGKKVPTCHRTSYDSIFEDSSYDMALEYSDSVARKVYRDEAKQIEEIRKSILEISSKEEPYDIFICYKETAEDGNRTVDSVIAQDVYTQLTDKGYKVFFARITLEDKLGQMYEPYIFSALNSARIMLVFGTDYEYFNAVWVKNEWSRYLKLMAKDNKKVLIPCYKGIDAYDMPNEFKPLQSQDMGKVGATQDLLRGIEKIIPLKKVEPVVQTQTVVTQSAEVPLLKRAYMFLEDGKWDDAKSYFNKVLDVNPECGDAYAGLFLMGCKSYSADVLENNRKTYINNVKYKKETIDKETNHISEKANKFVIQNYLNKEEIYKMYEYDLRYETRVENLTNYMQTENAFWNQDYFNKAKKFNNGQVSKQLVAAKDNVKEYLKAEIEKAKVEEKTNRENLENKYKEFLVVTDEKLVSLHKERMDKKLEDETNKYNEALNLAKTEEVDNLKKAIELLSLIPGFKDCDRKIKEFEKLIEQVTAYDKAVSLMSARDINRANQAKELFVSLGNFRDANDKVKACDCLINELNSIKKKSNKITTLVLVVAMVALTVGIVFTTVIVPNNKYNEAVSLMNSGSYDEAITLFESLNGKKDSNELILEAKYQKANTLYNNGQIDESFALLDELDDYKDASNLLVSKVNDAAISLDKDGKTFEAIRYLITYTDTNINNDSLYTTLVNKVFGNTPKRLFSRLTYLYSNSKLFGLTSNNKVLVTGEDLLIDGNEFFDRTNHDKIVKSWNNIIKICTEERHTFGLKKDGTVLVANGYTSTDMSIVKTWKDVIDIAAGYGFIVGLKKDGTVLVAGDEIISDKYGNVAEWSDIISISVNGNTVVGLKSDGTMVSANSNDKQYSADVDGLTDITNFNYVDGDIYALKSDGTMVIRYDGKTKIVNELIIDAVDTCAGIFYLKSDGTIAYLGESTRYKNYDESSKTPLYEVEKWEDIISISASDDAIVGLKKDGTVVAAGNNEYGECDVTDWTDIIELYSCSNATIGLKADGSIVYTKNLPPALKLDDWDLIK